jgi:hypothetical protein
VLVVATTFWLGDRLGYWRFVFYAAGLLAFASVLCLDRPRSVALWGLRRWRKTGGEPQTGGDLNREEVQQLQNELAAHFDEHLGRLEDRERRLADRLTAYQQWLEFPEPVDLSLPPAPAPELEERDRKLAELFESETERVFERIRKNAYSPHGEFQAVLVRDDVYAFIE